MVFWTKDKCDTKYKMLNLFEFCIKRDNVKHQMLKTFAYSKPYDNLYIFLNKFQITNFKNTLEIYVFFFKWNFL